VADIVDRLCVRRTSCIRPRSAMHITYLEPRNVTICDYSSPNRPLTFACARRDEYQSLFQRRKPWQSQNNTLGQQTR